MNPYFIQIGVSVLCLLILPCLAGLLFSGKIKGFRPGSWFVSGYILFFAAAEVITLPMIWYEMPLHTLVAVYGYTMLGLGAAGLIYGIVRLVLEHGKTRGKGRSKKGAKAGQGFSPYFFLAVFLIIIQIVVSTIWAHIDEDDSYFIGAASTSVYTDTIIKISAYTGMPYDILPVRYVLSPFPQLLAVYSQLCGGVHPAFMAHTIYPGVLLILAYCVYYQLGQTFFPESKDGPGIFLLLSVLQHWFSAVSVYGSSNFMMIRLWQGKAVLAGILLPATFLISIRIMSREPDEAYWPELFMVNLASCMVSSMGVVLSPLLIGAASITGAVQEKKIKNLIYGLICVIPSLVIGGIYLYLRFFRRT